MEIGNQYSTLFMFGKVTFKLIYLRSWTIKKYESYLIKLFDFKINN